MDKKELAVIAVLGLLSFIVWTFVPQIQVSGQTTTHYETTSPAEKVWSDGMGGTIKTRYVAPEQATADAKWAPWAELARTKTLVWVTIQELPGPNFLMIDLPYDRIWLRDNQGREYRLLNADLAASSQDKTLTGLLTAFDLTLMNSAFPGEPLSPEIAEREGMLVFESLSAEVRAMDLHLHYFMSGQKSRQLEFQFER